MRHKPHIPAPRLTLWAAILIATALGTFWLIALAATRFFGIF